MKRGWCGGKVANVGRGCVETVVAENGFFPELLQLSRFFSRFVEEVAFVVPDVHVDGVSVGAPANLGYDGQYVVPELFEVLLVLQHNVGRDLIALSFFGVSDRPPVRSCVASITPHHADPRRRGRYAGEIPDAPDELVVEGRRGKRESFVLVAVVLRRQNGAALLHCQDLSRWPRHSTVLPTWGGE